MIQRLTAARCPKMIPAKRLGSWIGIKQKKTVRSTQHSPSVIASVGASRCKPHSRSHSLSPRRASATRPVRTVQNFLLPGLNGREAHLCSVEPLRITTAPSHTHHEPEELTSRYRNRKVLISPPDGSACYGSL